MTLINSITPNWVGWNPTGATDVVLSNIGGQRRLTWGIATVEPGEGLGFYGSAPPQASVSAGSQFVLGQLSYFNYSIGSSDVQVTSATLRLAINTVEFGEAAFTLALDIEHTADTLGDPWMDRDKITINGGVPKTVTVGDLTLRIDGFKLDTGTVVTTMDAPEGGTTTVYLVATLVAAGVTASTADPCSGAFTPVFRPDRCEITPVCPIPIRDVIEDCDIPESPDPIIDCPDIDIPIPAQLNWFDTTIINEGGGGGGGGGGCIPRITVSYIVKYVYYYRDANVTITLLFLPPCDYHILFVLCLYRHPYYYQYDCCWWVWCPCTYSGYPTYSPGEDTLCPANGRWILMAGEEAYCASSLKPSVVGEEFGQVRIMCPCPMSTTTTTTTTTTPAPDCEVTDCGNVDPNAFTYELATDGTSCECLEGLTGSLTQTTSNCWEALDTACSGKLLNVSLCCDPVTGNWVIDLTCDEQTQTDVDPVFTDLGGGNFKIESSGLILQDSFTECCATPIPASTITVTIYGKYGTGCPTTIAPSTPPA